MGEKKIFVTYNGVSNRYGPVEDKLYREYVRDIYELPEEFILCVSNNKPHKNINLLVRGYCQADLIYPGFSFSCISGSHRNSRMLWKKASSLFYQVHRRRAFTSGLLDDEALCFSLHYEGLALASSTLEALACGTPVVVSRSSSLPEVVGDQAIFTILMTIEK